MSKIKIVSIDIDGTLLNDQREITSEVKSSIQQALANDVKIVITTGRPLPGVRDILSELGLKVITNMSLLIMAGLCKQ